MAHLTITDVKCHVVDSAAAGVEYKVTRTHLARGDRLSASRLRAGVMRQDTPNFAMTDIVNPEQSVPFVRLVPP